MSRSAPTSRKHERRKMDHRPVPNRIRTNVLEIAYEESGPAHGTAVLLMHGFPYDPRTYDGVVPPLVEAGCQVIVPYLRGYGPTRFLATPTVIQALTRSNDAWRRSRRFRCRRSCCMATAAAFATGKLAATCVLLYRALSASSDPDRRPQSAAGSAEGVRRCRPRTDPCNQVNGPGPSHCFAVAFSRNFTNAPRSSADPIRCSGILVPGV